MNKTYIELGNHPPSLEAKSEPYIKHTLPGGETLRAEGEGKDLNLILDNPRYKRRSETVNLAYSNDTFLDQDKETIPKLINSFIGALSRVALEWCHDYSLEEIVDVAWDPQIPIPDNKKEGWKPEDDAKWIDEILSGVHMRYDNDVYDFEKHRQDGSQYFDEWQRNTDEWRH